MCKDKVKINCGKSKAVSKNYRVVFCVLIALVLTAAPAVSLFAKEYHIEQWGCFLDMPQGMNPIEVTDSRATFTDDGENMFFQIKVYPAGQYSSAESMHSDIKAKIGAEGDGISFSYRGRDAVFADYSFSPGSFGARGYALLVNGEKYDWAILSFCDIEVYGKYHFFLLSALDSFSIDSKALYSPGPVSAFYQSSFGKPSPETVKTDFEGKQIALTVDSNGIESAEVTAEREALVLSHFQAQDTDAWSRFYRMIYRDNYGRLEELYLKMAASAMGKNTPPAEAASRLLAWLQGFGYSRTGTIADFSPPLTALREYSADCDSLALLYIILLRYYGIDAILMVSAEYSHSMAAVDVAGQGARFPFKERGWLVAEMTEKVEIGRINAAMADPAKWLGIEFIK